MSGAVEQFQLAITAAGLPAPDTIHADGRLHRFGTSDRRGDDSGWYVLHLDSVAAGTFGDWRTGLQSTWCSKGMGDMTPAERRAVQDRLRAAQRQRDAERSLTQQQAAIEAQRRWRAAAPATTFAYLTRKGIKPHGARIEGRLLLIALHDTAGTVRSLQTIDADGSKRFLPGGAVRGLHFMIGRPSGSVIVCEGFATGASLHEATGQAVAVAFNCGNLESVARALRSGLPCLSITIAADDDWRTQGNPGLTAARAAVIAVGGKLAVPDFTGLLRGDKDTDFNDLARLAGSIRGALQ